jgi:hypothetical protein
MHFTGHGLTVIKIIISLDKRMQFFEYTERRLKFDKIINV